MTAPVDEPPPDPPSPNGKVRDIGSAKKRAPRAKQEREAFGDWRDGLVYGSKGLKSTVENVILILGNDEAWVNVFVWNEFAQVVQSARVPPWDESDAPPAPKPGDFSDSDVVRVQAWLGRHYRVHAGCETIYGAVRVLAEKRVINPPLDWLESLRWDGARRVDGWLSVYLGADPSDYNVNVGRWMLISAVARLVRPGCKVDTMVVLEGRQGILKSTSVQALVGAEWFSDTPLELSSKDRFVGLRNNWCHEMAELDSVSRAEAARTKSFLSSPSDDYRPPYAKSNVKIPRRCFFVGSVNDAEYLRDATGNRRFWPVKCGTIDLAALKRDRDQLWAEAREMFSSGQRWWPEGSEVAECEVEQSARATQDAWLPLIETFVTAERVKLGELTFIQIGDVLAGPLNLEKAKWGQSEQNRVARCLLQLKWRHHRQPDGQRLRGYLPPEN